MDLGLTPKRRYVSTLRPRHVRGEEAVDCLAADDLAIFRSVDRRRGSPQVDRLVARCSVACNSRSSRPPNLLASCPLQAVPVSGPVVAYFLLLSSFTLLALFQMIAVGQLDSVRSAKNAQPI